MLILQHPPVVQVLLPARMSLNRVDLTPPSGQQLQTNDTISSYITQQITKKKKKKVAYDHPHKSSSCVLASSIAIYAGATATQEAPGEWL